MVSDEIIFENANIIKRRIKYNTHVDYFELYSLHGKYQRAVPTSHNSS